MFRWKRWAVAAVVLFLVNWKFVTPHLSPAAPTIMGNLVITGLMLLVSASVIVEILGPHLKTRTVARVARRLGLELVHARRNLFFTTRWVFEGRLNGVRVTIRMQYSLVWAKYTDLHIRVAAAPDGGPSAEGDREAGVHEELRFNPYIRDAAGKVAGMIEEIACRAGSANVNEAGGVWNGGKDRSEC